MHVIKKSCGAHSPWFRGPSVVTKIDRDVSFTLMKTLTLDTHSLTLHLANRDGADRMSHFLESTIAAANLFILAYRASMINDFQFDLLPVGNNRAMLILINIVAGGIIVYH